MGGRSAATVMALTTLPSGDLVADGWFTAAGEQVSAYWARWSVPRGDLNGDGTIDMADVELFVAVLLGLDSDECHESASDLNLSGTVDGADIQPFVNLLLAP
jgi:hypothetical protein